MNERIRQLMPKPWTFPYPDRELYTKEQFEKFAELIVRECVKLCEHESNDDEYDQYDMGMSVKAESIKTAIMEEFGIKE